MPIHSSRWKELLLCCNFALLLSRDPQQRTDMSPHASLELSGEIRLTDTHKGIQAKAGNATLIPEFQPTERPERYFLESLPWLFHYLGMYCVVVGDFATYMAGSQDVTLLTHWRHSAKTEVRVGTRVLYRIIWFPFGANMLHSAWISGLNDMTQWWNYWIVFKLSFD